MISPLFCWKCTHPPLYALLLWVHSLMSFPHSFPEGLARLTCLWDLFAATSAVCSASRTAIYRLKALG